MSEAMRRYRARLRQEGARDLLVWIAAPEAEILEALAAQSGRTITAEATHRLTEALQRLDRRVQR